MRRGSPVAARWRRATAMASAAITLAAPAGAFAAERGQELVTPADDLASTMQFHLSDPDGAWVYYSVPFGGGPDPLGVPDGGRPDAFGAHRTATGWVNKWLTPYCPGDPNISDRDLSNCTPDVAEQGILTGIRAANDGTVIFATMDSIEVPDDAPNTIDYYRSDAETGARLLTGGPNGTLNGVVATAQNNGGVATSADLDTVAFQTTGALLPIDLDATADQYFNRGGVLGMTTQPPACAGSCNATVIPPERNPVSRDGSRIFVLTGRRLDPADVDNVNDIYVYENGTQRLLTPNTPAAVNFHYATPDGSKVFWSTTSAVVPADIDTQLDTYATDVDAPVVEPEFISGGTANIAAGYTAASADGSLVLFGTTEQLADAPADALGKLYAYRDGTLKYIASLPTNDQLVLTNANTGGRGPIAVLDDGSAIFFQTAQALVPEDANAAADLYRWTPSGGLELLTPRPAGEDAGEVTFRPVVPNGVGWGGNTRFGTGISSDGTRAFFHTDAALVPEDTDGGRVDVYEWRAGNGVALVSPPGDAPFDAYIRGNSLDGTDVFYETGETVVGWDVDGGEVDIYDARIGGGFPEPPKEDVGGGTTGGGAAPTPPAPGPATTEVGPVELPPVTPPMSDDGPSTPSQAGSLEILSDELVARRRRVSVQLEAPGAGRVQVTLTRAGKQRRVIAKGSRRFAKATTGTVRLRLTRAGRRLLSDGKLRATIRVEFRSVDGDVSRSRARVTIEGARRDA